jgi:hypothetical protein
VKRYERALVKGIAVLRLLHKVHAWALTCVTFAFLAACLWHGSRGVYDHVTNPTVPTPTGVRSPFVLLALGLLCPLLPLLGFAIAWRKATPLRG